MRRGLARTPPVPEPCSRGRHVAGQSYPDRVIVPSPTLDDDLGLAQRVEDLAIKQFVAQSGIKTLDKAVLPRAARRDVAGLCADCADPILHRLGDDLGPVVGPDMPGDTAQVEQTQEHLYDADGLQPR